MKSPKEQWASSPKLKSIKRQIDVLNARMAEASDFSEMGRISAKIMQLMREAQNETV